jgi:hypothetical protein
MGLSTARRKAIGPRRRVTLRRAVYALVAALVAGVTLWGAACSAGGGSTFDDDDDGTGNGGTGGGLLFGGSNSGGGGLPPSIAFLQGRVLAPEGTIPISGALVYAIRELPAPIPDGVYCERCVDLPATVRYELTAADGTFTLGVPSLGNWNLVVQKGSFRRVRNVSVAAEGQTVQVPQENTTLPRQNNPAAGDNIPKIAVSFGIWDDIQDSLAKLGLGNVANGGLIAGSESFDIYQGSDSSDYSGVSKGPGDMLLTQPALLESYNIVFFPCTGSWPDGLLSDSTVIANLRSFVEKGGRLYSTDYSYDVVKRAFLQEAPINWEGDYGGFGDAESGNYDAAAIVNDPDMAAWLAAQNVTNFMLEDNWTVVTNVNSYSAPDENGTLTTLDPTVWVNGPQGSGLGAATISFQYGCGRALFSTYHTEAWGTDSLMPQERALLYIVLEIGVCIGDYPPPR